MVSYYQHNPGVFIWLLCVGFQAFIGFSAFSRYREFQTFRIYSAYMAFSAAFGLIALYATPMSVYTVLHRYTTLLDFVLHMTIAAELMGQKWMPVGFLAGVISAFLSSYGDSLIWFTYCAALVLYLIWGNPNRKQYAIAAGFIVADVFPAIAHLAPYPRSRFLNFVPTMAFLLAQFIWIWGMFGDSDYNEQVGAL